MGTAIIVPKEQTQRTTTFLCIYKYLHTFMKKKKRLCVTMGKEHPEEKCLLALRNNYTC